MITNESNTKSEDPKIDVWTKDKNLNKIKPKYDRALLFEYLFTNYFNFVALVIATMAP